MKTALVLVLACSTAAAANCPPSITAAATKAVPETTVTSCHPELEDGINKYEVKLARKDKSVVEVDVAQDASIISIEEPIALDKLPGAVTKAFAAKYPKVKPTKAERATITGKGTFFEIGFHANGASREATFKDDGTFVEEE